MAFWTRQRWRRSLIVVALLGLAYAGQVWADVTTHPDSETWHFWAIVVRTTFLVLAILGAIVVLRPDE